MSFLVDTNVFSEQLKRRPDSKVLAWITENEADLYVSAITIAEIKRGIEKLPDSKRKERFESWFQQMNRSMRGSILSFNRAVAHSWGQMQGQLDRKGITLSAFDGMIAGTAVRHNLVVVTRNVADFQKAPIKILNPFD